MYDDVILHEQWKANWALEEAAEAKKAVRVMRRRLKACLTGICALGRARKASEPRPPALPDAHEEPQEPQEPQEAL